MPFPSNIQAEVTALSTAFAAASPLSTASSAEIGALTTQVITLVNDATTALTLAAGDLDTFTADAVPADMAADVLELLDASTTQTALADLIGFAGRIAYNLASA